MRILVVANVVDPADVRGLKHRFPDCDVDIITDFDEASRRIHEAHKEGQDYTVVIFHFFTKRLHETLPQGELENK